MPQSDPPKTLNGQVLPALRKEAAMPIERPLQGISLFNRMHYAAVRKELEAYAGVLAARNNALRELTVGNELMVEHQQTVVRLERLDDLRAMEALSIDLELLHMEARVAQFAEESRFAGFENRIKAATLERKAVEAERALAEARSSPTAASPDPNDALITNIRQLQENERRLKAAIAEAAGGEANLTEEDRALMDQVSVATRERIARLIEGMVE